MRGYTFDFNLIDKQAEHLTLAVNIQIPELTWRFAQDPIEGWDKLVRLRSLIFLKCYLCLLQRAFGFRLGLQVAFFLGSGQRLRRVSDQAVVMGYERLQLGYVIKNSFLFT